MLTNRQTFTERFKDINEGMAVYCRDGEKLGKVRNLGDESFTVEKGYFFPKDFTLRYDDVYEVRDGSIYTTQCLADVEEWRDESYTGWSQVDDVNAGRIQASPKDSLRDRFASDSTSRSGSATETTRVPVYEEMLDTKKNVHETGEVQVKKVVHTELKHLTIPVSRDEVRVERVPVSGDQRVSDAKAAGAFQEKEIRIPVTEEELVVTKRPVVKEEIVISKERHTEQRDVSEKIRKEDVIIDDQAARRRPKTPPSQPIHP